MIIAVTGHRPNKLGGYADSNPMKLVVKKWLNDQLVAISKSNRIDHTLSGMAIGVDQWFAEVCLFLKIPFRAVIPFEGQEIMWPRESQEYYHRLLSQASDRIYTSIPGYAANKMQIRNIYMVNNCDLLLAVWDGTAGGTANCVKYAVTTGKKVIRIPLEILKNES